MEFRSELAALSALFNKASTLEAWNIWYDRCQLRLSKDTKYRWVLANAQAGKREEALLLAGANKNDVEQMQLINAKRLDHRKQIRELRGIIENILNFKVSEDSAKDILKLQQFQKDLKKLPEGILKQFGELLLAKEAKNRSAIKRLMEEVIHWEYRVIPFYGVDIPLAEQTWASVDQLLFDAANSIADEVLLRAFATRVFQFVDASKLPKFADKVDLDWSLNELRKYVTSAWYANRYPAFWYNQMSGRVAQSEIGALIDSLLTKQSADKWSIYDIWVFGEWLPVKAEYRAQIVSAASALKDKKEPYLRELLIRLSENTILRRELEKKDVIASKALFKLKRDYYLELLHSGAQVDYAIYQLASIGDEDRTYLWWYALNPFQN